MGRAVLWILCAVAATLLSGCFDLGDNATADPDDPDDGEDDGGVGPGRIKQFTRTVEYVGVYGAFNLDYTDRIEVEEESNLTVIFENDDGNPLVVHDWYLEELDIGTERIPGGETTSVSFFVDLEPGEYVYYCSVGSHRQGGMEGTLVVTPYTPPE